jgi:alkylation response protein AidB-like acyl-CoA dehydrogenase
MSIGLFATLVEEQELLLDASERFIEERFPLGVIRESVDAGRSLPADDYRRHAAELGWLGLLAPEEHGGGSASGNGLVDAALVAAERGARLHPGPFVGHHVVVDALARDGSSHHAETLAALVAGRAWATWAFAETSSLTLRETEGTLRLDGSIGTIAEAGRCEWLLVGADGPQGTTQGLIRTSAPGVTIRPQEGLDVSRSWGVAAFDAVSIAPEDIVGQPGATTEAQRLRQAGIAAVLGSAEAVGAMDANLAQAVQYAKDRIAFGRPIGSFQAIKHLLADTTLWLEMSKALVASAATALGDGAPDGPELAHAAKSFVGEKAVELSQNCFQVFGGIGYTWEHDEHLFLRRLAADAATFGTPVWHRARLLEQGGVD